MKTYRFHYQQMNEGWLEIEASSKWAAINKANRQVKEIYPEIDTIELPNGEQEDTDQ